MRYLGVDDSRPLTPPERQLMIALHNRMVKEADNER